jgi:hypothetical protein
MRQPRPPVCGCQRRRVAAGDGTTAPHRIDFRVWAQRTSARTSSFSLQQAVAERAELLQLFDKLGGAAMTATGACRGCQSHPPEIRS